MSCRRTSDASSVRLVTRDSAPVSTAASNAESEADINLSATPQEKAGLAMIGAKIKNKNKKTEKQRKTTKKGKAANTHTHLQRSEV